ncbi:hypothetical protein BDB01DRAFT_349409 [Pilobolus umbonatus]|nr:hypothetical protein BDB01DRAFT_349409 [Pilobolus umbonatus]
MRLFTFILTALAVHIQASVIYKREISSSVQECINKLSLINTPLVTAESTITGFVHSQGYSGALTIQDKTKTLEDILDTSTKACCIEGVTMTTEEIVVVLDVFKSITPPIQSTLRSVITKKPDFDSVPLATNVIKKEISALDTVTDKLIQCLIERTPALYLPPINAQKTMIDTAFDHTKDIYGLEHI